MDINALLNKFIGSDGKPNSNSGVAGGALAGGVLALLMGNKGVAKFAGTAASVGGMALLGGMAMKAFQNWQNQKSSHPTNSINPEVDQKFSSNPSDNFQLEIAIIKAMVGAAKADGHIDSTETAKIFKQAQDYALNSEEKALIFDLISRPISIEEISSSLKTIEHRAEVYLASKIACGADSAPEKQYLANLAEGLALPPDLVSQLDRQVQV